MNHVLAQQNSSNPSSSKTSSKVKRLKMRILSKQMEKKHLLKLGNLVAQAELDHLDSQTFFGALVTIKEMTELRSNLNFWKRLGKEHLIEED